MNVLLAEWYATERTRDLLKAVEADRLAAHARPGGGALRRTLTLRWPRAIGWLRVHLRHAVA